MGIYLVYVGLAIFMNYDHPDDYPAVIIDKYAQLEKWKDQNKIVIIGGSSSAYGIDSERISEEFSLPVVNTSVAMGIESEFQVHSIRKYLTQGDIVLGFHEYEYYFGNDRGDDFINTTLFYYPQMFFDFTFQQKFRWIKSSIRLSSDYYRNRLFNFQKRSKTQTTLKQYSRRAYNSYGDNIYLLEEENSIYEKDSLNRYEKLILNDKSPSEEYFDMMKEFNHYCKENSITFIMGYPPLERSQYDAAFSEVITDFKKKTQIEFLGTIEDNLFEAELFYDTSYHLIGKGRNIRTNRLIEDLKKRLN